MGAWLSSYFRGRPESKNPTVEEIVARQQVERAQQVEADAKEKVELERERARERQKEADRAAALVEERIERLMAEMEEVTAAARHAEELAEESTKAAKEDAERYVRGAQEKRERVRKMKKDVTRAMRAAKEEGERARQVAERQRRAAEQGRALAEERARRAAEEAQRANKARAEVERRLKEGIQPVVTPTAEELAEAKRRIQYREDCFHFAVVGNSGSGKSSLVNAFRGVRNGVPGAAAVGVTETTLRTTRYEDVNPESPYVWYDVPGAGTLECPDWQYFNDQGLYVFDCIIVLFDNRFTKTDAAILTNARRFNIPTYIVRSKADQHIRNIMKDKGYNSDRDDEDPKLRKEKLYKAARWEFIKDTVRSVRENLQKAGLPDQYVYIVSSDTLLSIVGWGWPSKVIGERKLINDLINEAYARRRRGHETVGYFDNFRDILESLSGF